MAKKEYVKITPEGFNLLSVIHYANFEGINRLSQKEIYFTEGFKSGYLNLFQVVGNLGGLASMGELNKDHSIIIVSDKIIKDYNETGSHPFMDLLEGKLNQDSSPYRRMSIISEAHLITYLEQRISKKDENTRNLLKLYKTSDKATQTQLDL